LVDLFAGVLPDGFDVALERLFHSSRSKQQACHVRMDADGPGGWLFENRPSAGAVTSGARARYFAARVTDRYAARAADAARVRVRERRFGAGTLPPSRRASESPIAIACFRRVTFFLDLPERNKPAFISCTARFTLLVALRPYFLRPVVLLLAKSTPPCCVRAGARRAPA
jgi:hypothetical protein